VHTHTQADLLLPMQQNFFNQKGKCCMNWRTVEL